MVYEFTLQVQSVKSHFSGLITPVYTGTKKLFCIQPTGLKICTQSRQMSGDQIVSQKLCICSGPYKKSEKHFRSFRSALPAEIGQILLPQTQGYKIASEYGWNHYILVHRMMYSLIDFDISLALREREKMSKTFTVTLTEA